MHNMYEYMDYHCYMDIANRRNVKVKNLMNEYVATGLESIFGTIQEVQ